MAMEAAVKQISVGLDDGHARTLADLAAERHVGEVELAGEVLAAALDDFAALDSARITEVLQATPGSRKRAREAMQEVERGEGIPLSDLL